MKKLFLFFVSFQILSSAYGQTWSAVGNGVNCASGYVVNCFAVYNGELYVGGRFYLTNFQNNAVGLLKWNGTSFDTLSGTNSIGATMVSSMVVYNGELYMGGYFNIGTIAKWDGTAWNSVGSGLPGFVFSLEVYHGNLYAGSSSLYYLTDGGIDKWDGNQWTTIGTTNNGGRISQLKVYNDELYAAGGFGSINLNSSFSGIARWNDYSWNEVGPGGMNGGVSALSIFNNDLYAGGGFTNAGGVPVNDIAKWNGTAWSAVGSGITSYGGGLTALEEYHDELYAGGDFVTMDGDSLLSIARYNGATWDSVGSGVDSTNISIDTIIHFPFDTEFIYAPHIVSAFQEFNDELYVGGTFNMIGGVTAHNIAKWSAPVGIAQINQSDFYFSIYPNPATSQIQITLSNNNQTQQLKIINTLGQVIKQQDFFSDQISLDISDLAAGVYLLEFQNQNERAIKKSVKE